MEQAKNYVESDKNMIVQSPQTEGMVFYDVRKPPFAVYGFYDYSEQPWFVRLPEETANVNEHVARLSRETSGGRVRFSTDSPRIAIRAEMADIDYCPRLPLISTGGFDLYCGAEGERERLCGLFVPPFGMRDGYEQTVTVGEGGMRSYTVHFPVHSRVKNLYIGIEAGSSLCEGAPYGKKQPIVFYGSSITHGTGASRPGLTYPAMLARRLNLDILNLGFSGNAKGEIELAEYIAALPMCAFVLDYDHNAPTPEWLERTHQPFFECVRAKNPTLPVLMLTRPSRMCSPTYRERREIVLKTYRQAKERGDENVYFLDCGALLAGVGGDDGILDVTHTNDLGFTLMADGAEPILRAALGL